jgi:hypothetical protein
MLVSRSFGQFESLKGDTTSQEKLEQYFMQADDLSKCYAIAFKNHRVTVSAKFAEPNISSTFGISMRSSKPRVEYYCCNFEGIGIPPIPWRYESLQVNGLEQQRHYSVHNVNRPMVEAKKIEPDPETGLRAPLPYVFVLELDPFGLVLGGRHCTRGNASSLDVNWREWLRHWNFDSDTEKNGVVHAKWKRKESTRLFRQIDFDSKFGNLPVLCHVILSDKEGKRFDSEIRTKWSKLPDGKWAQSQVVVLTRTGNDFLEETIDFVWVDREDIKLFMSQQDWNNTAKDAYAHWYDLFTNFMFSPKKKKDKTVSSETK